MILGYIDESEHQIFLSRRSNNFGEYKEGNQVGVEILKGLFSIDI